MSLLVILAACTTPIAESRPGTTVPAATAPTGSLTIELPAVGSWLKPFLNQGGAASRALLRATSVSVSVEDSYGYTILPAVVQTISVDSSSVNTSTALTPITGVVVGSNYTVRVRVYNSNYSGSLPTVSGSLSGVSITKGNTTSVTVTCTPYSYSTLVTNVAAAPSLAGNSEVWYRFTSVANLSYTLSQSNALTPAFLFDSSGNYLQTISSTTPYNWTPTTAAVYYVGVANTSAGSQNASTLLSAVIPPANEGSTAVPIVVGNQVSRGFTLGPNGAVDQYSYYKITTDSAGDYYFSGIGAYQSFNLYTNADFTNSVRSKSYVSSFWLTALNASTTYYLRLQNMSSSSSTYTGTLYNPTGLAAVTNAEGSPASYTPLTVGVPYSGKVGVYDFSYISYYSVTTGATANYQLGITNVAGSSSSVAWAGGSYPGSSQYSGNSLAASNLVLSPNTTYYFQVYESGTISDYTASSKTTFSIGLSTVVPPSGTALTLDTPVQGTLPPSLATQYFTITLDPGSYAVSWEDSFSKASSTVATADIKVSAFNDDYTSGYFYDMDSGYTSPQTVTIGGATPQTIHLVVTPYGSAGGTFWIAVSTPSVGNLAVSVK